MMAKRKKTAKSKPISNEDFAPDRGVSRDKMIPIHELNDWIGPVKNHYKTDAIHLWDNHFRINVWTSEYVEDRVYEKYSIDRSFHVVYNSGSFRDISNPKTKERK